MSRGQGQRDMSSKASVPVAVYPFGSSPWSLALLICKMGIVAHPSLGCCEVVIITAKPSAASHQGALVIFLLLPLENPTLSQTSGRAFKFIIIFLSKFIATFLFPFRGH